jgi:nucleolar complex protein 2
MELSKLAETDPEFYKYLQENDKELLEFDPHTANDEENEDSGMQEDSAPVLRLEAVVRWQKALLEVGDALFIFHA